MKNIDLDKPMYVKDGAAVCGTDQAIWAYYASPESRTTMLRELCAQAAGPGYRVELMTTDMSGEDGLSAAMYGIIEVVIPTTETRWGRSPYGDRLAMPVFHLTFKHFAITWS